MARTTLENLPGDVLILILSSLPDRKSLKALVHASPSSHRAYLAARSGILRSVLENYHDVVVDMSDAITAVRSEGKSFIDVDNYDTIVELLDGHKRERRKEPANVDETIQLLRLHEIARWFLKDYEVDMPRPYWISKGQWVKMLPLRLSATEKARFMRGFYRLEIWSNIFANVTICPTKESSATDGLYRMVDLFFMTMPPWEVKEVACSWAMLRLRLMAVFEERIYEPYKELANFALNGPRAVNRAFKKMSLVTPDGSSTRYEVFHCLGEEEILFWREDTFTGLEEFGIDEKENTFHYPASQYEGRNRWKLKQQIARLP